jgi:hypothetical protein
MTEPTRTEDTKNLSIITGAGLLGLICTVALFSNAAPHQHRTYSSGPVELSTAAPDGIPARGQRLYGTLVTRAGLEFTGYVAWDVDEIFTSDILDGDDRDQVRQEIPFGDIVSIHRESSRAGGMVLADGRGHGARPVQGSRSHEQGHCCVRH